MSTKGNVKGASGNHKTAQGGRKKRRASTYFTVLLVIVIIAVIFGGVFYIIISNNLGGFGEKHRTTIQNIPVFKNALPAAPDPLNPKYMTSHEIEKKYVEFRDENLELKKQLDEANKKANEYKYYMDDFEALRIDAENKQNEIKERTAALDAKELQINEMQKKADELIAYGNKEAFKDYYETIDSQNAEQIYSLLIKEQQTNDEIKKFAQIYASMDGASAARIFEQLGDSKMEMIAETLKAMSRENSSVIIESMTPAFAAKVTVKLDELYRDN